MKKDFIFYTLFLSLVLSTIVFYNSCNQYITRNAGGTTKITLEPGEKLMEVTWKNDGDIWYLVEPMDSDYVPKTKIFKENSTFGVLEGQVIFVETR